MVVKGRRWIPSIGGVEEKPRTMYRAVTMPTFEVTVGSPATGRHRDGRDQPIKATLTITSRRKDAGSRNMPSPFHAIEITLTQRETEALERALAQALDTRPVRSDARPR